MTYRAPPTWPEIVATARRYVGKVCDNTSAADARFYVSRARLLAANTVEDFDLCDQLDAEIASRLMRANRRSA